MAPNEILAEKMCSWWIFGNAKHYNDIAFLGARLSDLGEIGSAETREEVFGIVERKLAVNRRTSAVIRERVDALNAAARASALRNPAKHVDSKHDFKDLDYLTPEVPTIEQLKKTVRTTILAHFYDFQR